MNRLYYGDNLDVLRRDIAEGAGSEIVSVERFEVLIDQRGS